MDKQIERFRNRMEAVRAEVHLVTKENLTEKRISLCQEKNLQNLLYSPTGPLEKPMATAWQQHAEAPRLVTHETDVDEQKEEIFFGIDATITSTRSGIADTGTLIIWPTADEPRSLSLVPPVHFALLEVGNLHNTFAEVLEKRTGAVRCQPMPCLSPVHQNLPISNRHWPMAFMDR
ncbi:MAG: LUD domain-containing protein [Sedimenticolaceae bacterium]